MATRALGASNFIRTKSFGDATVERKTGSDEQPSHVAGGDTAIDDHSSDRPDIDEPSGDVGGDSVIDPASLSGADADAPYGRFSNGKPRKRAPNGSGRKSGGNTSRKTASETSGDISRILFSMHMMAASFLKVPELALDDDEAKTLADAVNRVTEQYDIPLMDEKTRAWVNLAMVGTTVYGPRLVAFKMNRKKKPSSVVPIQHSRTANVQIPIVQPMETSSAGTM